MKPTDRPPDVFRLFFVFALVFLLAACGGSSGETPTPQTAAQEPVSTPASTPPETPAVSEATPEATPTSAAQAGSGEQSLPPELKGDGFAMEFSSPEGGFTLPLPEGWNILSSEETALGVEMLVGPQSIAADDPAVSKVIYADVTQVTVESAIEALCAGGCDPVPQAEPFMLGEHSAWRVTIPGEPVREWVFVDNGDMLVFFSILDPETQTMRDDIVQAIRFSPIISQTAQSGEIAMVVRQQISAERQLPAEQITVKSVEPVDWPNSCLGAAAADEMCAEVITPGFRVIVDAGGEELEYHTDITGQQIRLATR
jgi:hypothetical protein